MARYIEAVSPPKEHPRIFDDVTSVVATRGAFGVFLQILKGSQAGSVAKASPKPPNINEEEKRINRLEKLKRDLQNIKNERDKLQRILANYTNKDLNNRINFETFMLEMQHDQVMTDLKRMPQDISEALDKCKELTKENQFYW
ncbi:disks large homolog 5-like [Mus pahari]|uniref:disks large homolog 5-like n=1 Tax=Mus pahari TaxID=10093 RepID=UPI000A304F7D|nr:disks large homolog 5-like [Mus pahari]